MSPHPNEWQTHAHDASVQTYRDVVHYVDLQTEESFPADSFGLLGFACDEGIRRHHGRLGAAHGPVAFKTSLGRMPLTQPIQFCDVGTVTCSDGHLEEAQQALSKVIAGLLEKGVRPLIIGGGQETGWGAYQGMPSPCVFIHFGAQFPSLERWDEIDCTCLGIQRALTPPQLIKKAYDLKMGLVFAEEFHEGGSDLILDIIEDILSRSQKIFISLDLDLFAAPFAPGVSIPQVQGILPWDMIPILQRLALSGKVGGLSINELSPPFDRDGITAQLAAELVLCYCNSCPRQ